MVWVSDDGVKAISAIVNYWVGMLMLRFVPPKAQEIVTVQRNSNFSILIFAGRGWQANIVI